MGNAVLKTITASALLLSIAGCDDVPTGDPGARDIIGTWVSKPMEDSVSVFGRGLFDLVSLEKLP